jgi:hypothetical protein
MKCSRGSERSDDDRLGRYVGRPSLLAHAGQEP